MKTWALAAALILAGCQTTYGPMTYSGGYEEIRVASDTWRLSVRGNGYTGAQFVEDMALLRAAEITQREGYSHFIILSDQVGSRSTVSSSPTSVTMIGNQPVVSGGGVETVTRTGGQVFFKTTNSASPGAMDAALIIQQLKPKLAG